MLYSYCRLMRYAAQDKLMRVIGAWLLAKEDSIVVCGEEAILRLSFEHVNGNLGYFDIVLLISVWVFAY
jgi:hypothetical protein